MKTRTSVSSLSPEYALLGFLDQRPAHGYELHQRLAAELGQIWRISQSQVYTILNRLEANGLIQGALHEQVKLPARRQFALTDEGRRHFETWLNTPSGSSARAIRVEFASRLYFASERDARLAHRLIDEQAAAVGVGLERLEQTLRELPREQVFNRLGLDLRIRQLASIKDWLRDCHAELGQINSREVGRDA